MTIILDLSSGSPPTGLPGLRTRLKQRGFDFLTDTQCDTLINEAYQEICDLYDWPFLETTVAGAAPLTVADLRMVLSVRDTPTRRWLELTTREELIRSSLDVAQAGSPVYYWLDGQTIVTTWPVGGTLSVRYLKVPVDLSATNLTPVIPPRYHDVIVTGAARKALLDESASGDFQAVDGEYQRRLQVMHDGLIDQSADTEYITTGGGSDW